MKEEERGQAREREEKGEGEEREKDVRVPPPALQGVLPDVAMIRIGEGEEDDDDGDRVTGGGPC